jgi:hypothetical protein
MTTTISLIFIHSSDLSLYLKKVFLTPAMIFAPAEIGEDI